MKQRLSVIFGTPFNIFELKSTLYNLIESELGSKLRKVSRCHYTLETPRSKFFFYVCYKPTADHSYNSSLKYFKEKHNARLPLPVDKTLTKVKDSDKIIIIGTCGGLQGERNKEYYPTDFYEVLFSNPYLDQFKIAAEHKISIHNILFKSGREGVLTSNITFNQDNTKGKSLELLKSMVSQLSKEIHCIDMESYPIVKHFKDKSKIGVFLVSSDVIGTHNDMNFDLRTFQKKAVEIIKKLDEHK